MVNMQKEERPFKDDKDGYKELTVKDLIEVLKTLPENYLVTFNNCAGIAYKEDLTIYHDQKAVSING